MAMQLLAGRYQIISKLGSGAFGQTYLAEDRFLPGNPLCVVKKLQPKATDSFTLKTARRLFDTEAQVLYKLGKHEQIPGLLAHFEENHEFYLVQDFVEGNDLGKELDPQTSTLISNSFSSSPKQSAQDPEKGVQLSEAEVIAFLREMLPIVEYVHKQNVIHRDIKPSNLIRRKRDHKLVLIDFGAVKQISTQGLSNPTVVIGTQGYMAFEQLQGNPRCSSDIYALGMTAIQALTGKKPKQLPRDDLSQVIWRNQAQVSDSFAAILNKMVRHNLRERYQSVEEVLNDLKKITIISSAPTKFTSSSDSELETDISQKTKLPPNPPDNLKILENLRRLYNPNPWYIVAILIGCSATLGVIELFQPTLRPIYYRYQGQQQLESNKAQVALESFQKVIDIKPENLQAWNGQGDALYQLERYEDALSAYEQALKLKSNDLDALNGKGQVLNQIQRPQEALEIFQGIIDRKPRNAQAWKGRGDALYRLERYRTALAAYNKSIQLKSNNFETWNRKGRALYKLQRYPEALEVQEKALKIEPNNAEALSDKGIALIGLQKYEEALVAFNKAQEIKPLDPRFWQNKGLALQYLGRAQEALNVYQEALVSYDETLNAKPNNATSWVDRGYVLTKLQRYEEALASYEKAIEIKPDFYLAWLSKGNVLFPLGRYHEAMEAFDKALEIRPQSYLTWHNRGSLLIAGKKDFPEAIASFDQALKINPSFHHAWRDRGSAFSQLKRYQEAITSFDRALGIEPNDHRSWVGRGIALTALQRYNEARVAYNKAIDIQPKDPLVWMNRGLFLEKVQDYKEAIAAYETAIEIEPRFEPAIRALERLRQRQPGL